MLNLLSVMLGVSYFLNGFTLVVFGLYTLVF